jgi:thymidylate kinase
VTPGRAAAAPAGTGPRRSDAAPARGFVLAVVGPDGAGKTTLATAIASSVDVPTHRSHLGLWGEHAVRRAPRGIGFATRLLRRRWRLSVGRWHRRRGHLVIHDRFPTDALLDAAGHTTGTRLRRRLLAGGHDRADLVVLLDAPGPLLAARTGGDPEHAEDRRRAYHRILPSIPDVVVVDADRPVDELVALVLGEVEARWSAAAP